MRSWNARASATSRTSAGHPAVSRNTAVFPQLNHGPAAVIAEHQAGQCPGAQLVVPRERVRGANGGERLLGRVEDVVTPHDIVPEALARPSGHLRPDVHPHQSREGLLMMRRVAVGVAPAHRVAYQREAVEAQGADEGDEIGDHQVLRVFVGPRRLAMAALVERENMVVLGDRAGEGVPQAGGRAETVVRHQRQRGGLPLLAIVEAQAIEHDELIARFHVPASRLLCAAERYSHGSRTSAQGAEPRPIARLRRALQRA